MPTPVETTALDHRRAAVVVVELIADNLSAHKVEVATEDVTLVDGRLKLVLRPSYLCGRMSNTTTTACERRN